MGGYPVVLTQLAARRCVVVGGGAVAARKAEALAQAGALPLVISPELGSELAALERSGQVQVLRRRYRPGDLKGAALAIAATGDRSVNAAVSAEAQRRGVPVNVVDDPALCTFIAPAVVRRGDVVVAVSTGGGSPALARHLRELLEGVIDPAYGELLPFLAELRPRVLAEVPAGQQPQVWRALLEGELLACLRAGDVGAARARAEAVVASAGTDQSRRG